VGCAGLVLPSVAGPALLLFTALSPAYLSALPALGSRALAAIAAAQHRSAARGYQAPRLEPCAGVSAGSVTESVTRGLELSSHNSGWPSRELQPGLRSSAAWAGSENPAERCSRP
jgi:hypothetical protein